MKLYFLGTGASDFGPRLWTDLADKYDNDVRRSNAVLIDGQLLIDCGDWILNELEISGTDISGIRRVLVSHSHHDHFRPDHLCAIALKAGHSIEIYANAAALDKLKAQSEGLPGAELLLPHLLEANETPTVVEFDGYTVTPLRSNHQTDVPGEQTLHFLIEKDGKTVFYGTDGAWLPTATGKYLYGKKLNCYLFDATCGDYENDYRIYEHNTMPMIRMMLTVMRPQQVFAEDARLVLVHLAPSLHKSHAETVAIAAKDGLLVAYDGMTLDI